MAKSSPELFIQLLKELLKEADMSSPYANLLIDSRVTSRTMASSYLEAESTVCHEDEALFGDLFCESGRSNAHKKLTYLMVMKANSIQAKVRFDGLKADRVCSRFLHQGDASYGSLSDGFEGLDYNMLGSGGRKRKKEDTDAEPLKGKKPRREEAKKGCNCHGNLHGQCDAIYGSPSDGLEGLDYTMLGACKSKRRQRSEHAYDEDEPVTCKKPRKEVKNCIRLLGMAETSTMLSRLGGGASKRKHLDTNVFPDLRTRQLPRHPRGRLLDRIDRSGLILKHVEGDGNCQFRSLSKLFYKTQSRYHEIRLRIVDEMRGNKDLYMAYGALLELPGMRTIREFDDYLAAMSRDKTWGDIITLFAATNVFEVRASIISSFINNIVREVVPECLKYKKDIYLAYVYISEDDAHYDALVHRDELPSFQRSQSLSPVRHLVREHFEVVVENIPYSWRSDDLRGFIETCVKVANARVMYTRHGRSRGYGYVEIKYERDVDRAVAFMDGSMGDGRRIHVRKVIENDFDREAAAGM